MCELKNKLLLKSFVLILLLFPSFVFSQQYKINSVEYSITGLTKEFALEKAVDIDFNTIFKDKTRLEEYLEHLHVKFLNERVLKSAIITPTYLPEIDNLIPVDLLIETTDSMNFFVFPNPKLSLGEGRVEEGRIKLDSKHYNFLGSMNVFDAEVYYEYEAKDPDKVDDTDTHGFGTYLNYAHPFNIGAVEASWKNTFGLGYTLGHFAPTVDFSTGLSFVYDINDIIAIAFGLSQGIVYDQEYKQYGDEFYFTENVSFSLPITLAKTVEVGDIQWIPSISASFYWDIDGININNEDLYESPLSVGHEFTFGRIDWIENFQDGFNFSFLQKFSSNLYDQTFSASSTLQTKYCKAWEHLGLKSRLRSIYVNNDESEVGPYLRGVGNNAWETHSALVLNFDLPIKVWKTDWVGYGFWDWTKYIDFEFQLSPFIDVGLGYNPHTETTFSLKDGYYGAGIEAIVFLDKFRSVQGRVGFGVDIVQTMNKLDFMTNIANKLFNTGSWRGTSWYELSIGIGLFY